MPSRGSIRPADPGRAAGLLERQRWYLWEAGDRAAAAAAVEEASRLIPSEPPSEARARILAHHAGILMFSGRFAESMPIAEEALDVARTIGSPSNQAMALGIIGTDLALLGRVDEGVDRFREGLAIAEELGGVEGIALGQTNLAILLDRVGRTAEALEVAAAGWERARDIGVERTYGGLLLAVAAKAAIALGRWDEAETFLALGLAHDPVGTPGIRLRIQRGRLDTMRGDLVRAAEVLAAATRSRRGRRWHRGPGRHPRGARRSGRRRGGDVACQGSRRGGPADGHRTGCPIPRWRSWPRRGSGSRPMPPTGRAPRVTRPGSPMPGAARP